MEVEERRREVEGSDCGTRDVDVDGCSGGRWAEDRKWVVGVLEGCLRRMYSSNKDCVSFLSCIRIVHW